MARGGGEKALRAMPTSNDGRAAAFLDNAVVVFCFFPNPTRQAVTLTIIIAFLIALAKMVITVRAAHGGNRRCARVAEPSRCRRAKKD